MAVAVTVYEPGGTLDSVYNPVLLVLAVRVPSVTVAPEMAAPEDESVTLPVIAPVVTGWEARTALYALMRPPPMPEMPISSAFLSMQERTSSLRSPSPLLSAALVMRRAAKPATWGDATEVPDKLAYLLPGSVE